MSLKRLLMMIAVFIPLFALYVLTSPATVFWQDSGIYLSGIKTLGIIYPPGYPLYVLGGWLWTKGIAVVLPGVVFTKAVHMFSGALGAGSAVLVAWSVYEILEWLTAEFSKKHKELWIPAGKINLSVAAVSGLASGLSYSIWSQSINSEVYSLAGFFAAAIFFQVVKLLRKINDGISKEELFRGILILFVIWGFSFANHPLTAIFLIPIGYLIVVLRMLPGQSNHLPGRWRRVILLFLAGASVFYIYLPVRSAMKPEFEWTRINSLQSLVKQIVGEEYFSGELSLKLLDLGKIASFPRLFFEELLVGMIFFAAGLLRLRKEGGMMRIFANFGVILGAVFYLALNFYAQGSEYNYWLIPFYIYCYIIIGVGLWFGLMRLKQSAYLFIFSVFLIVPLLEVNMRYNERSGYVLAKEFGENILANLPEGAVLFTLGDQDSATVSYMQGVEDFRSDVIVIWGNSLVAPWRIEKIKEEYPDLEMPEIPDTEVLNIRQYREFIHAFLDKNMHKREVFLIHKSILELPEGYELIPAGTLWKVNRGPVSIDLNYWNYSFSDEDRYEQVERNEAARKVRNEFGVTTGIERMKYSFEAKNFELQALKNLADTCFGYYKDGRELTVNREGSSEVWKGERLLQCARDYYEKMFEVDADFYHPDIWESRAQVYRLLGEEEKYREIHNQVLIRSTNK